MLLDQREVLVFKDQEVRLVSPEKLVCLEKLDHLARMVSMEKRELQVPLEHLDHQVSQDPEVHLA